MTVPRTDLALEAADDLAARAKNFAPPEGIRRLESLQEGYAVTDIRITCAAGAQALGKPVGRYITVDLRPYFDRQRMFFHRAVWCIAYQLRSLLPDAGPHAQILVAGLGNRAMTPDAVGPIAVENLLVTRHMVRTLPRQFQGFTPVSALCTGVLARTGLETLELIQGAAARVRPAAVIAIDALAARSRDRLCATVQLSDTGLTQAPAWAITAAPWIERRWGCRSSPWASPRSLTALPCAPTCWRRRAVRSSRCPAGARRCSSRRRTSTSGSRSWAAWWATPSRWPSSAA